MPHPFFNTFKMEKKKLENKADKKSLQNKSNKFIVIKEFCGIEKKTVLTIKDSERAKHMLKQGYVKNKD